ncbi:MAG: hypothetical protein ACP5L5_11665 [Vulcanisaeta sp.]|uniref:hypothetical protein n=1 Tax=Vulcanisaeta sp. TaxID=2020871 RepID=UPI003D0C878C
MAIVEGNAQVFGTVAGPTRLYVLPSSVYVSVFEDDTETEPYYQTWSSRMWNAKY